MRKLTVVQVLGVRGHSAPVTSHTCSLSHIGHGRSQGKAEPTEGMVCVLLSNVLFHSRSFQMCCSILVLLIFFFFAI